MIISKCQVVQLQKWKMMSSKSCVVLWFIVAAVIAEEKYTAKYDNINFQEILDNRRLLVSQSNCILDKGKCSPEAKEVKMHITDALETGCTKCNELQKDRSKQMIDHLIKHERAIWRELTDKYDPQGVWRKKYEDDARKNGIIIPED